MLLGFIYACASAITYGTVALFSLPLTHEGISFTSNTFYRFSIAAICILLFAVSCKRSLRISKSDVLKFAVIGFFYMLAALTFVAAFDYMDSGIVGTVQFCYPIFVIFVMVAFFGEKFHFSTASAAFFIMLGVAIFSMQDMEKVRISFWGMALTIFSAAMLALYVLGIQVAKFETTSKTVICGYIMLFASFYAGILGLLTGDLQSISTPAQWENLLFLSIISSATSNLCMVFAVQSLGPSLASIFNGLEPLTVMLLGVLVFNEHFTWNNALGAMCIVGAVFFVAVRSYVRQKKALATLQQQAEQSSMAQDEAVANKTAQS